MLIQEVILNIFFSATASIAFFYIYKKTHMNIMLLAGGITYFELLCRLFMSTIPTATTTLNYLMIPEIAIILYMIYYTWHDGFTIIPLMLIGLLSSFTLLLSIGHTFYGDIGIMFSLILIIWVSQSQKPCTIDPFNCRKCE